MSFSNNSSPKSAFSNDIVEKAFIEMPNDNGKMVDIYDKMTPDVYDQFMGSVNYREPQEIVKEVVSLNLPKESRILDAGAGTGLIGELLTEQGYTNLDAMDACQEFLKALDAKNIYKSSKHAFFGQGNLPEEEQKEQYDVVTAAGVFLKGHMPREGMQEIHGFLRPGGYFVTAMRDKYYTEEESECRYYSMIQELLQQGKFKMVMNRTFKRGLTPEQNTSGNPLFGEFTSILFVFQKC